MLFPANTYRLFAAGNRPFTGRMNAHSIGLAPTINNLWPAAILNT